MISESIRNRRDHRGRSVVQGSPVSGVDVELLGQPPDHRLGIRHPIQPDRTGSPPMTTAPRCGPHRQATRP